MKDERGTLGKYRHPAHTTCYLRNGPKMQIEHSEFQDQLVRGLSHRMNNILTLFHGYLGLLMDDRNLDPITRAGLNKIRDGARAATDLMERTHAISRPASSVRREVNLADFFHQLAPT